MLIAEMKRRENREICGGGRRASQKDTGEARAYADDEKNKHGKSQKQVILCVVN